MNETTITATFTVQILKLQTYSANGLDNIIRNVGWKLVGVDGGHTASLPGGTALDEPDANNFKPFNAVTEADVLAWLEGSPRIQQTKIMLQSMLNQRKTEPVIVDAPLPWAQQ